MNHFFGKNTIGFSSIYPGRIASFTGEELKIGGFYFGFFLISLTFLLKKKVSIFLTSTIVFLIAALLIGEKSNLIKIVIGLTIFLFFMFNIKKIIKILLIPLAVFLIILSINLNTDLRESFVGQLPLIKQGRIILHTIYPKYFSENKSIEQKSFKDNFVRTRYYYHYNTALKIAKKNIFFGAGLKNFRNESYKKEYYNSLNDIHLGGSTHPHQIHLEILSELGLFGYLLIMSNLIYILFNQRKNNNFTKFIGISFLVTSLIPFLPSGSFFTSYGGNTFFYKLFFFN